MTILNLPAEQADTAPRELWEGEAEGLAEAAAVGRRAADWVRYLPVPVTDRWTGGPLADAVETAMTVLDPGDADGVDRYGKGGVGDGTTGTLAGLAYAVPEAARWLTLDQ